VVPAGLRGRRDRPFVGRGAGGAGLPCRGLPAFRCTRAEFDRLEHGEEKHFLPGGNPYRATTRTRCWKWPITACARTLASPTSKPGVIGHSFGGLLTQIVAGRGLSAASVAIDAAPFPGVLPLPISSLKAAKPVLGNPANRHRAVPLTYDQFRFASANAVSEKEAHELYDTFAVPASGVPLFQAAAANLNPWSEAKVDTHNPARGPLLIISGEKDNTVPRAISEAAYKQQHKNPGITEFVEVPGRGHALTIDSGWREVAGTALAFVQRFV